MATHYEQTARRVVQLLRYATGCPESEARRAVQAAGPDYNEALYWLQTNTPYKPRKKT